MITLLYQNIAGL